MTNLGSLGADHADFITIVTARYSSSVTVSPFSPERNNFPSRVRAGDEKKKNKKQTIIHPRRWFTSSRWGRAECGSRFELAVHGELWRRLWRAVTRFRFSVFSTVHLVLQCYEFVNLIFVWSDSASNGERTGFARVVLVFVFKNSCNKNGGKVIADRRYFIRNIFWNFAWFFIYYRKRTYYILH